MEPVELWSHSLFSIGGIILDSLNSKKYNLSKCIRLSFLHTLVSLKNCSLNVLHTDGKDCQTSKKWEICSIAGIWQPSLDSLFPCCILDSAERRKKTEWLGIKTVSGPYAFELFYKFVVNMLWSWRLFRIIF
jgi:hypothetical protein